MRRVVEFLFVSEVEFAGEYVVEFAGESVVLQQSSVGCAAEGVRAYWNPLPQSVGDAGRQPFCLSSGPGTDQSWGGTHSHRPASSRLRVWFVQETIEVKLLQRSRRPQKRLK